MLLSGALSASRQQELSAVAKALDPIRLFHQVEHLQQATFRCEAHGSSISQPTPTTSLVPFELEGSAVKLFPQESTGVLDWRRTSKDPFAGQWEQILSWVQTNPTRSSGDIFRELQSLFPGCYQPQHMRTLQRGMRRIREYVLATREEPQQREVIHGNALTPHHPEPAPKGTVSLPSRSTPTRSVDPSPGETSTHASRHHLTAEKPATRPSGKAKHSAAYPPTPSSSKPGQIVQPPHVAPAPAKREHRASSPRRGHRLSIARAIQSYLQAHRTARHRQKTLEWHQTALRQFQHYLRDERHLLEVSQITETDIRDWITSLGQTPTPAGKQRSTSTIETYARSVRAFCAWLVHQGALPCSPMSDGSFPRASVPLPHVVSPETFEQFVRASVPLETKAPTAKRDRALLWVLFDTGITLSEVCALRLCNVDQKTGILSVRGKGGNVRRMTLGAPCLSHLLSYLDQAHPAKKNHVARRKTGDDPLFFSEHGHALTKNGVTSFLSRLRKRAGSSDTAITPQLLRHSFALRYLQAGGDPQGLQELLGYEGMAPVRQYLRWQNQWFHNQAQKESEEIRWREDEKPLL